MPRMASSSRAAHAPACRDPLAGAHPWYVLMRAVVVIGDGLRATMETILAQAPKQGLVEDAVIAESLEQRKAFWQLRDHSPTSQKPEGGSIKHDVSVPVAAVPDFIAEANAAVEKLDARRAGRSRSAISATATSTTTSASRSAPTRTRFLARWDEVNAVVHDVVQSYGGSISAEHGIGVHEARRAAGREGPGRARADAQLKRRSIRTGSSIRARCCRRRTATFRVRA